jgi:hypothetical protein
VEAYNILYSSRLDVGSEYILVLSKENLKRFVDAWESGDESFFSGGKNHFISDVHDIQVFDTSLVHSSFTETMLREKLKEFIAKRKNSSPFVSSAFLEKLFSDCGKVVTDDVLRVQFGSRKKSGVEHSKVTDRQYVNSSRISELEGISSNSFSLNKLIKLCFEINSCYAHEDFYAVGMLTRAIIDHIPPIFAVSNFDQVASNYKAEGDSKSFKESMEHLNRSMKKISDSFLHSQIRKSEVLPNEHSVDCKRDLDRLLGEVVRKLSEE